MKSASLLPLIRLAEVLRERDLAALAKKETKVAELKETQKAMEAQISAGQTNGTDGLQWPGASERWLSHMQLKAARLQAALLEAEAAATIARSDARRSFGRAMALEKISKRD